MRDRGLDEFDLVYITSFSRDETTRAVFGYRAVRYDIPRGCAAGYMPELNVLCGIADYSTQNGQRSQALEVEITLASRTVSCTALVRSRQLLFRWAGLRV